MKVGKSCLHNGERHPFLVDLRDAVERARCGSGVINQMLNNRTGYLRYSELRNLTEQLDSSPLYSGFAAA